MKLHDITENYYTRFPTKDRMGSPVFCDIYKNPTRKEFNYVQSTFTVSGSEVPGWVDAQGNLYIWTPYLFHQTVMQSGKIPQDSISVRLQCEHTECVVDITTTTKRPLGNVEEIKSSIFNSYISKLFTIVEISFPDPDS